MAGELDVASAPEVYVRETAYEVSLWPPGEETVNSSSFTIRVEWRGEGRWAVLGGRYCLGTDGEWDWEAGPSNREDEWLATHRFTLEAAIALAREAAPRVIVGGMTAVQARAREAAREREPGGAPS
jgi:hypothetical protein